MQVNYLSPSKLEKLRLCEARLEAQLFDEGYEEEKGEAAASGTLAHEAAKLWYRLEPAGGFKYTDPDQCFKDAMEACAAKQVRRGQEMVTISELPKEASSIQEARTAFDMIIAHYKRDVIKAVFSERRYKGHLKNGVPIHLIVDLGIDRGNGTLEIVDYKTGFLACTTDGMWDKDQVLMNLLAVRRDPEFQKFTTIQFTYFWVKKGYETGPISLSDERLGDYEHWLALEYKRVLEVKNPAESLNRFCTSCGRRDECTKYRKYMSEAMGVERVLTPDELRMMDDEVVMSRHDTLKGQIKLLEDLRDALGAHLKGAMSTRQVSELTGKTFKAVVRSSKHNSYSVATVVALCQAKGKDPSSVFSIKQKEVESLFADDAESLSQLNLTMKRGQTAPSLQVSQVGGSKRKASVKKKDDAAALPQMPVQPLPGTAPVEVKVDLSL